MLRNADGCRLAVRAEAGHLNFLRQGSCTTGEPETLADASRSVAGNQQPPYSVAGAACLPDRSSNAKTSSAQPVSLPLDTLQHQGSQRPWSIPASYTGQGGCMASRTGLFAQADAGAHIQTGASHVAAQAKQCHLPVDMDSSVEWAHMQGLQSQQPGSTRAQQRSPAKRETAQTGAAQGSCAAAEL